MLALTDRQLRAINAIIADYHKALAIRAIGADFFPPEEVRRLVRKGLVQKETAENYPRLAYLFGRTLAVLGDDAAKALTFKDFLSYLKKHPLYEEQVHRAVVKHGDRKLDHYTKSLGNDVAKKVREVILRADRKMKDVISEGVHHHVTLGVERGDRVHEIIRSLQDLTGEFQRNWQRIVVTEMNDVMIEGQASEIAKSPKGGSERVFKRPRPDCCQWCKSLYLMPDGVTPRVFTLEEMRKAGDNNGLRKADWKAVLGSVHAHCRCNFNRLPDGFGFDVDGKMVFNGPELPAPGKITKADVRAALEKSAVGANELYDLLRKTFAAGVNNLQLD
jgi:hypothetical protein